MNRFNGSVFLEEIRGKRLVFVGDSLNKNQWTSMLCLIESSLDRSSSKPVVLNDNLFVFHATVRILKHLVASETNKACFFFFF